MFLNNLWKRRFAILMVLLLCIGSLPSEFMMASVAESSPLVEQRNSQGDGSAVVTSGSSIVATGSAIVPSGPKLDPELTKLDVIDFEPLAGETAGDPMGDIKVKAGTATLAEDWNNTKGGFRSMELNGKEDNKFEVEKKYAFDLTAPKVSIDFYDDLHKDRTIMLMVCDNSRSNSNTNELFLGIKDNSYSYRAKASQKGGPDVSENVKIKRTKGWHTFSIDFTTMGEVRFLIDQQVVGTVLNENYKKEFLGFNLVRIINYWKNSKGMSAAYADNLVVELKKVVPINLVGDDIKNTLSFDYFTGYENPSSYEITKDGGNTWKVCESNPINIGNVEIAPNKIGLRVKSSDTSEETEIVWYERGFTFSNNSSTFFEYNDDISGFAITGTTGMEISKDQSRSGISSLKVTSQTQKASNGAYQFEAIQKYPEIVKGQKVSIWYYDTLDTVNGFLITTGIKDNKNNGKVGVGVINNLTTGDGKKNYSVRAFGENIQIASSVERSRGWHNFVWDFTNEGKCVVSIDQTQVGSYKSSGFDTIAIIDYWSKGRHSIYLDDLEILDKDSPITEIPAAPTAPVTDDQNKTFGFTYVTGMENASAYEYSINGGATFLPCTSNPQELPKKGFAKGQIMVRLKATETSAAGAVLRNDVAFTDTNEILVIELQKLYDKASSIYPEFYEKDGWNEFELALEQVRKVLEQDVNSSETVIDYREVTEQLETAMGQLKEVRADQAVFEFEDKKVSPFTVVTGNLDWGEYTNISIVGSQALKVATQEEDGSQVARIRLSFAQPLTEDYFSFYFRDIKVGGTQVKLLDSETNNGILFYGNDKYYYKLITNGEAGVAVNTEMRRNNDWYNLQFNLAADDKIHCSMDTRNWLNTDCISKVDTIEISYVDSKPGFLTVDNFQLLKKNPVTEFELEDESVTLGYYDTYEMNVNHVTTVTEKPYQTTDFITWESSNPEVASVTSEGSIEYVGEGTAQITQKASSGASATIQVTCKDIKATGIQISDSDYNDTPHFVKELTLEPGQKKIVNAILSPEGVTLRKTSFESSDKSVVTVKNGELTAIKEGTATITVTSEDVSCYTTLTVKVEKPSRNAAYQLYVALDGNDYSGDGTKEKPFATIERARDELRTLAGNLSSGAEVIVMGGTYTILKGVEFDEQDQGSAEAPIVYRANDSEQVNLSGSIHINAPEMKVVTDPKVLEKLPEAARGNVYEYDLSDIIKEHKDLQYVGHSIGNLPWLRDIGKNVDKPYYSLSFDDNLMTLSRWPNNGFTKINSVENPGANPRHWKDDMIGNDAWVKPEDRDRNDTFEVTSKELTQRMQNWVGIDRTGENILSSDIWMSGYWYNDFSDQSAQIRSISSNGSIKSDVPSGYSVRSTQPYNRFYVYNLLQELDIPGEWYFDQSNYTLYVYPPEGTDMTQNHSIKMAVAEDTVFNFEHTSHITMDGLNIQGVLGHAIEMYGCDSVKIKNTEIQATELKVGIIGNASDGTISKNCGFENCEIKDVNGGISINGGNPETLESQGNYITNCHFKNYAVVNKSYNPAISLGGVGNRVSSCKIEDGPHNALMYSGNDNIIEFTEFTDVVKEAKDQSAIYTGRDVLNRGNVIRNCYFHDIPKGSGNPNSGIYLDDLNAGAEIIDNTFENMGWGIFVNGGRDNFMVDNEFINCQNGIIINDWGYTGVKNWELHGYGTKKNPTTMVPTEVDWSDRTGVYGKYEHLWCILQDNPLHSKYNTIIGNKYSAKDGKGLIYYMSRGVQKDFVNVLNDWYYIKDNR